MMKYIPVDVFDCVSDNLDIISIAQLGKVCCDTRFLAKKASKLINELAYSTINNLLQEMIRVYTVLSNEQNRHVISKKIAERILQSDIADTILNTICMSFYEMTGEIFFAEPIFNVLNKIHDNITLTDTEKKLWSMFQHFWLGSSFYISILMHSTSMDVDVLFQMLSPSQLNVTVLKSGKETICCDFNVYDIDKVVSFISNNVGNKFYIDMSITSCQIVREYTFSKTPSSFDRLYYVYLHVKDIQMPFFQFVKDMEKNIKH